MITCFFSGGHPTLQPKRHNITNIKTKKRRQQKISILFLFLLIVGHGRNHTHRIGNFKIGDKVPVRCSLLRKQIASPKLGKTKVQDGVTFENAASGLFFCTFCKRITTLARISFSLFFILRLRVLIRFWKVVIIFVSCFDLHVEVSQVTSTPNYTTLMLNVTMTPTPRHITKPHRPRREWVWV